MKKRYQIFISSTFADLKDERRMVMQAVLERKCFPAGMELFPAIDKKQFVFYLIYYFFQYFYYIYFYI